MDCFLFGHNEFGLLLFYGDLDGACKGWAKNIDAWRNVKALADTGDINYGAYVTEQLFGICTASSMMAAGEFGLLREWMKYALMGVAARDALVAETWKQTLHICPYYYQNGPEGAYAQIFGSFETALLRARALNAVLALNDDDAAVLGAEHDQEEPLRSWLPSADELLRISVRERELHIFPSGAVHPALLCARLYASGLGEWGEAAKIAKGLLDMPRVVTEPLMRIEAWRMLAECREATGDGGPAASHEALEQAASEARQAGYVWYEKLLARV